MTTANMKLVILDVALNDKMESPGQDLQDGEAIVRRIVELKNLYGVLKGKLCCTRRLCSALASFDLTMNLSHAKNTKRRSGILLLFPLSLTGV